MYVGHTKHTGGQHVAHGPWIKNQCTKCNSSSKNVSSARTQKHFFCVDQVCTYEAEIVSTAF
jgi:hypothetical protein